MLLTFCLLLITILHPVQASTDVSDMVTCRGAVLLAVEKSVDLFRLQGILVVIEKVSFIVVLVDSHILFFFDPHHFCFFCPVEVVFLANPVKSPGPYSPNSSLKTPLP